MPLKTLLGSQCLTMQKTFFGYYVLLFGELMRRSYLNNRAKLILRKPFWDITETPN